MSTDVYPMLRQEREGLASYLSTLRPDDWDRPSLCDRWSVKQVVAHVVSGARSTPGAFIGGLISSGFNFEKWTAKGIRREMVHSPEELIAALRNLAGARTKPGHAHRGVAATRPLDAHRPPPAVSGTR